LPHGALKSQAPNWFILNVSEPSWHPEEILMTPHALDLSIELPWLIFLVYWISSATRVNKTQTREPRGRSITRRFVMWVGYVLLWPIYLPLGVLDARFAPWSFWLFVAGAALTWCGVTLAIWARYHIGRYWSSNVALREEHQLIRTGPYARIRHPIYTGILLAASGTTIAVGRYRCLVAVTIFLVAFVAKSMKEEALLRKQFGGAFEEHRRQTGFFLPRFS
jgi:protein-S-isoprenylcysteine O-methyltransferase Ste14